MSMNSLGETEATGAKFAESIGAKSLAEMRSKSAEDLLAAAQKDKESRFWPSIDGYVIPEKVSEIFAKGKQAHVPLLAGWNAGRPRLGRWPLGARERHLRPGPTWQGVRPAGAGRGVLDRVRRIVLLAG